VLTTKCKEYKVNMDTQLYVGLAKIDYFKLRYNFRTFREHKLSQMSHSKRFCEH